MPDGDAGVSDVGLIRLVNGRCRDSKGVESQKMTPYLSRSEWCS